MYITFNQHIHLGGTAGAIYILATYHYYMIEVL